MAVITGRMNRERNLRLARVAALAAAYWGAAELGLSFAFATPSVSAVWAPTGIALAALVLFGFRLWPGVALGALLANAWTGVPVLTVLGITAGNTLEALTGAYLLTRVADFQPTLKRVRDIVWLVAGGAIVSTAVSATIGTASLLAGDEIATGDLGVVWRTWWLGDMGGNLLIAPLLMVAFTHWPYRRAPGGLAEAIGLALALAGTALLVFTREVPLTFLLVPLPIVAAFRFRQAGAVSASLIAAAIAIPLTEDMQGPFASYGPDDRLLLAQFFVGVTSVATLVLAAVITERERAEESVRAVAETLQRSLLPSVLPSIPGIETAVHFRPAGEPHLVGGDFYELVEGDDGSVGVAIGDALGKGAIAAADTALARYTLLAATLHESEPSRILSVLNEAMVRKAADPCTAVYARLDLGSADAALKVSIGGHPKPLIVRRDGVVEAIGAPSPPLGIRRDLKLTDHRSRLGPGDALVLYTDGLTDAYAPERVISPEEIADGLRPWAGAGVAEIVEAARRIATRPGDGREPRDDILVLALRIADNARSVPAS